MENVTTTDMRNHGDHPVIFHLGRDPGERFPLSRETKEYRTVVETVKTVVEDHRQGMVPSKPQLEWCDQAVMNWAPKGCRKIGKCQQAPPSSPKKCFWPH